MVSRKRARDEMEAEEPVQEPTTLHKLRNMWQFANLAQYLYLFVDALKFDKDFDIEELESECLKPEPSEKLAQLGLALLKHVSSNKGLTPEIFDEYARRQFLAKAPQRNPFGADETPNKFNDLDVFTKIRVLQQLSLWTLNNPNSIRERLGNMTENEQRQWRIEPFGFDREGRTLLLLDDFRFYRLTDPPPPPKPKSKAKSRKSKGTRNSKRRKVSTSEPEDNAEEEEESEARSAEEPEDDGLGGKRWECLCITLEDYREYMTSLKRSKDPDEKELLQDLERDVIPAIEQQAEERTKKEARKMKEQETLMKLATAKRSSRISSRMEKQKETEAAEAAERKRQDDIAMARAEEEWQRKLEEEHDSRRMTREQRLKERENKRILEEEKLRQLQEDKEKLESNEARMSERHLRQEMERRERELQKLKEDEEWTFDCEKCGKHGTNLDDGTLIVECEKCNIWQHGKCHGITKAQAEREDFHFICTYCKRKEEEAKQPKLPPLKLRLTSASPSSHLGAKSNGAASTMPPRRLGSVQIPVPRLPPAVQPRHQPVQPVQPVPTLLNGPSLSPRGQALGPPGIQRSEAAYGSPYAQMNGNSPTPYNPRPDSAGHPGGPRIANGFPTSSPPQYQSPRPPATPYSNFNSPYHQQNGSPYMAQQPFKSVHNPPYTNTFSRPASSAGPGGPYQSPVKHSPVPSPKPANSVPNTYNFNSPHSSFPPSSTQQPSFSPTKHSSPPPPLPQMSSPGPVHPRISPSPAQMPAQMLPNPLPPPEKHDGARPISSHSVSEKMIFPPITSLSPDLKPQILSPPMKKPSPTPERAQLASFHGNGFGGVQ